MRAWLMDSYGGAGAGCWKEIVARLLRHGSRPAVDQVFDFEGVKSALARLSEGPMGKAPVRVA
jgi:hypothetical protein